MLEHRHSPAALSRESQLDHLSQVIEHAAHLLPDRGPLTVFIHHNPLQAFEDLHFDEAVPKGARIFGCHRDLADDRYRTELLRDRIPRPQSSDVVRAAFSPDWYRGRSENLRFAVIEATEKASPNVELR